MVSVNVSGEAYEVVSAVTGGILSVTSNEPDDGLGDGDTANDIVITGPGTVSLRAERSGKGNGRIYTFSRNYAMECTPHPDPLPIGWGEGTRIAALRQVTKW